MRWKKLVEQEDGAKWGGAERKKGGEVGEFRRVEWEQADLRWRVVGGGGGGDGWVCEESVWRCRKKMTRFRKGDWSNALEQRLSCMLSMCEPEVHP